MEYMRAIIRFDCCMKGLWNNDVKQKTHNVYPNRKGLRKREEPQSVWKGRSGGFELFVEPVKASTYTVDSAFQL